MDDGAEQEPWPLWEDKGKWPFTPTGYVFLADAGNRLGQVFYPRDWGTVHRPPDMIAPMQRLFADGLLRCAFRPEGTASMIPLPQEQWHGETESVERLIRTCWFNALVPPMDLRIVIPVIRGWLFVYRPDLERYLRDLNRLQADLESKIGKPPRGRPKNTGGYRKDDLRLVERMHQLIQHGEATGRWDAARIVAPEAKGSMEPDAKEKRLLELYNSTFPSS